ncbi:hypothetical protein ACFQ1I_40600 [Kitasatospora arboriphila]
MSRLVGTVVWSAESATRASWNTSLVARPRRTMSRSRHASRDSGMKKRNGGAASRRGLRRDCRGAGGGTLALLEMGGAAVQGCSGYRPEREGVPGGDVGG